MIESVLQNKGRQELNLIFRLTIFLSGDVQSVPRVEMSMFFHTSFTTGKTNARCVLAP